MRSRSSGSSVDSLRSPQPRRHVRASYAPRSLRRFWQSATAALGAGVLIAVQLATTHWFYLYIVWFVPFVLVALFAGHQSVLRSSVREEHQAEPEPVFA